MWRQNPYLDVPDSDQSISDCDLNFSENPFSKDDDGNIKFSPSPVKVFERLSAEELISDDEENNPPTNFSFISKAGKPPVNYPHDSGSRNLDGASTWSTVFEEAKELMGSAAKKNGKGSGGKTKPRFLFRFHSDKEELSLLSTAKGNNQKVSNALEGLKYLDHGRTENSMTRLLEGLEKAKEEPSKCHQGSSSTSNIGHRNIEHPMAEILESVLEKNGPFKGAPKMSYNIKGKRLKFNAKGHRSSFGYRTLDGGDPPETLDSTLGEEEAANFLKDGDRNLLKLATLKTGGKMMANRFHEALEAATVNDQGTSFATSKQTGAGYYGRLLQVMQTEKERQLEFLKQSQEGRIREDVGRYVDVKILSRYLDAKLIVCQCSFNDGIKTIIFSSKISDNVDLEVGSLVRVHSPWKEVKVLGKEENIMLCTYFSQIPVKITSCNKLRPKECNLTRIIHIQAPSQRYTNPRKQMSLQEVDH